jgi:hypothetical protein
MALPPGIVPKVVTVGIASFFDGTLAEGTATIVAPVNVVHTPTNRPIFSSTISQRFVDGMASFTLAPTDAAGLNRVDWTYTLRVVITGALVQPDPVYFTLPKDGPDTVDLDGLVTVPSSAGIPISVDVLTATDITNPASDVSVALRATLGSADPVLSNFTYDPATGNLLSYQEDGITITLTYNADGTVATSKRGTAAAKTYSYSGGNLVGIA